MRVLCLLAYVATFTLWVSKQCVSLVCSAAINVSIVCLAHTVCVVRPLFVRVVCGVTVRTQLQNDDWDACACVHVCVHCCVWINVAAGRGGAGMPAMNYDLELEEEEI